MLKTLFAIFALFTFGFSVIQAQIFTPPGPLYPAAYVCYDVRLNDLGLIAPLNTRNNVVHFRSMDGSCSGYGYPTSTLVYAQSQSEAWWACVTTLGYLYLDGDLTASQASANFLFSSMPDNLYFCSG